MIRFVRTDYTRISFDDFKPVSAEVLYRDNRRTGFMYDDGTRAMIILDQGLQRDEAVYAFRCFTERLIRLHQPEKLVVRINENYKKIPSLCGFYPKGKWMQKFVDPWRLKLPDGVFDDEGMIINQGKMEEVPFGWFNTKTKGCGWIAVYNLMKINYCELTVDECLKGLDRMALLGHVAGQMITLAWIFLRQKGLRVKRSLPSDTLTANAMDNSDSGILLYSHRRGAHYTAYRRVDEKRFQFFNAVYGERNLVMTPGDFLSRYALFPLSCVLYVPKAEA